MSEMIYPRFCVGVYHAKDSSGFAGTVQECVSRLRSQGFRISMTDGTPKAGQYDALIVFCAPGLESDPAWPSIRGSLQGKPCLAVLLQGGEEVPALRQAGIELLDCRENCSHMEVPLSAALRRIELSALIPSVSEEEKAKICPDCFSVYRRNGMRSMILPGRQNGTFVRILLALGRGFSGIDPMPEWLVYEDPEAFLPDSSGEMSVCLAKIGSRNMDRSDPDFGAYHLDEPVRFKVPERLLYRDRDELAGIASGLLKDPDQPEVCYQEADPDNLYLTDMDLNTPVPDGDTVRSIQQVWADQEAMEKEIRRRLESSP